MEAKKIYLEGKSDPVLRLTTSFTPFGSIAGSLVNIYVRVLTFSDSLGLSQDGVLSYYISDDDPTPRNQLILEGCTVEALKVSALEHVCCPCSAA